METPRQHWKEVYVSRPATEVSWFRPHLDISLALIERAQLPVTARIIDVGGGASTLVDDLLGRCFREITVLDIADRAMVVSRERLGQAAASVTWMEADVTSAKLPEAAYDLWHDRAVFHFLTDPEDRNRYISAATAAIRSGGQMVIGTFGPDGPLRCSGLDIVRYSAVDLAAQFADEFDLLDQDTETHVTPSGRTQSFVYCRLAKR